MKMVIKKFKTWSRLRDTFTLCGARVADNIFRNTHVPFMHHNNTLATPYPSVRLLREQKIHPSSSAPVIDPRSEPAVR